MAQLDVVSLFLGADPIVKSIMIILALASVACWTVILDKTLRLRAARRQACVFAQAVDAGPSWDAFQGSIALAIAEAGRVAWSDDEGGETRAERRERIERAMHAACTSALKTLDANLPLLATVGSAAPFVGLLGTVWGIITSFSAIAQSQDTSLAVVAPGIAEALFATAIGLVAAIPAVVAYNKFATDLGGIAHLIAGAIAKLGDRLARDRPPHREVV